MTNTPQVPATAQGLGEIADCPECGNSYLAVKTDLYKDKREFIYCDCCGAMANRSLWQKAALASEAQGARSAEAGERERHIAGLIAFAKTAPGRLPSRVREAITALATPPEPASAPAREGLDIELDEEATKLLAQTITGGDLEPDNWMRVRLLVGNGHSGHGLYVAAAEYQEEGAIFLAATPAAPAQPREAQMVTLRTIDGEPTVWCDPEIADLVDALNTDKLATIASCSGHGHRPGSIALKDGRWLFVATEDQRQVIEATFPVDVNGAVVPKAQAEAVGVRLPPFEVLSGLDKAQDGYQWRMGWNEALRRVMDYNPPAAIGHKAEAAVVPKAQAEAGGVSEPNPPWPVEALFDPLKDEDFLEWAGLWFGGDADETYLKRAFRDLSVRAFGAPVVELQEQVEQLTRALREATESPTFMGEPALSTPAPQAREPAEPVGEVVGHHKVGFGEMPTIRWRDGYWPLIGTKLYAAPSQAEPAQPQGAGDEH